MFKKILITLSLFLFVSKLQAQTTFSTRINHAFNDMEEWIAGPPTQTKTVGAIDWNSSDLEFGWESTTTDPQLVGLRFTNITIPKGAIITKAYIQFTVDATSKNADPCNVVIRYEPSDNPLQFDSNAFHLSNRSKSVDSISWNVTGSSWNTVGSAGVDQRTANLKTLVQQIVERNGWASGNAMAFFMKGTGTREVESFDGDAPKAPQLVIEYITPVMFSTRVSAAFDDIEEWIAGPPTQTKTVGGIDWNSSDLEFGWESTTTDPQLVGLRFQNINIPKGSMIKNAYIQFTVDATSKNADPCNVVIRYEPNDNPTTFDSNAFHLSNRSKSIDSVYWSVGGTSWSTVGSAGVDQRTPNLGAMIQNIVNRNGWNSGNAMAFFLKGTGTREVESFDGDAPKAAQLVIEYIPVTAVSKRIDAMFDDLEEWIAGPPTQTKGLGDIDYNSSDIEFGWESTTTDPQLVGLRFTGLQIPNGAQIQSAYIQFTVDATAKNSDPCNVIIRSEPSDNASPFDTAKFFLTNRSKSTDSVYWAVGGTGWNVVGTAGVDQRTADLKNLVQNIVNRGGWNAGNAMAFYIKGTGTREVESFDGDAPKAPMLVINYLGGTTSGGGGGSGNFTPLAVTNFPVANKQAWYFWDKKMKPSSAWKDTLNVDSTWKSGNAPLGYGDAFIATKTDTNLTTAWFRKVINVSNVSTLADTLELNLTCDDGALIFVNGIEVLRRNLPAGMVDSNTMATANIEGMKEMVKYSFDIPKTAFRNGKNVIAVELHNGSNANDMGFDIEIVNRTMRANAPALGCNGPNDSYISCFGSILPIEKVDSMGFPAVHAFQKIFEQGQSYVGGTGVALGSNDFTGYIPNRGSSLKGWVAINHETGPGAVSLLDVRFDCSKGIWMVDSSRAIDFTDVVLTAANCSGGVTPWETSVTCEETYVASDANSDGYQDLGWMVEIDPRTKKIKQQVGGKGQKLWAMGRMSHENVCFKSDSLTAYYGEDAGSGNVYKFVANNKMDLSSGTIYVLKLDSTLQNFEPRATVGVWVPVPNTTQAERNTTRGIAATLGATPFSGVEDVEINPVDKKIYFTAKGNNRTYRFKDNGTTVSEFETYVGGKSYRITTAEGLVSEDWGGGNDNLTFDSRGNLYVLQDGSRDHIWLVKAGHTQANPKLEIFMTTPKESEPTGMTLTPDERFMFLSIQSPSPSNTTVQKDAAGNNVVFNKATTIVIALDPTFSKGPSAAYTVNDSTQCLNNNNFSFTNSSTNANFYNWNYGNGGTANTQNGQATYVTAGNYDVRLVAANANNGCIDSTAKRMTVYAKPAAITVTGPTTAANNSTQSYSVTNAPGSTYQWWINNGAQASGSNTNTIGVTWAATGATGDVRVQQTDANTCVGDTATLKVSLSTVGVNELATIEGLKIYPNPFAQQLIFESNLEINIAIFDINGREITSFTKQAGKVNSFDLSDLSEGTYFVKITDTNNQTVVQQLMKINR
jgi:hypothetical protein